MLAGPVGAGWTGCRWRFDGRGESARSTGNVNGVVPSRVPAFPLPLPQFPFSTAAHDRLADERRDQAFLEAAWDDESTRVLEARGSELATNPARDALRWVSPRDASAGERMLLGRVDEVLHFLVLIPPEATSTTDGQSSEADQPPERGFASLRRLATNLDAGQASLAVHASALSSWHRRHPRCSVCGAATESAESGATRHCPQCETAHFPRTDPAVIMLAIDDDDRCLLGHNAAREAGWFSTLAGFVEPGESPEQAVVRELEEETGVRVDQVTYAGAQPWPFPSSLMLGFFAHASRAGITVDGDEITEARWFSRDELKAAVESGEVGLPTSISIAYALVSAWYGEELPDNVLTMHR